MARPSSDGQRVLISGAGIAGPVCAYWLHRAGFSVTIVERASRIRKEGQTVDVTTEGRVVFDAMGITKTVMDSGTKEKGLHFVDSAGTPWGRFPVAKGIKASFTREIEVVRGELARILWEATRNEVEYIFDDSILHINQEDSDSGVEITFAKDGRKERYDILVIADGLASRTRAMAFNQKVRDPIKTLNQHVATFSSPSDPSLDGTDEADWAKWYCSPGRKVALSRPDGFGRIRSNFIHIDYTSQTRDVSNINTSVADQKAYWATLFKGQGWECERLVKGMLEADDFYVYEVAQVKMGSTNAVKPQSDGEGGRQGLEWSKGRVVMIGDAASCPSPISGQGTNVAITQAYVLASMLRQHASDKEAGGQRYKAAFEAYEDLLGPWVQQIQKLAPGAPEVACPETKYGIYTLLFASWIGSWAVRTGVVGAISWAFGRFFEGKALELPSPDLFGHTEG